MINTPAKIPLLIAILILLVSPLAACGGGNGGKSPVKIGALADWTGPGAIPGSFYANRAIKLVEKEVKDMGGILEGREVKFVKYDGGSTTSGILTAATKALYSGKMPVLVWGGTASVNGELLSDFAEKNKILFINPFTVPVDISSLSYTVRGGLTYDELDIMAGYAINNLDVKRAAILNVDLTESRAVASRWQQIIEAGGGMVVYKDFAAADIADYTSYLTKIKYSNPDVLLTDLRYAGYEIMAQQLDNMGGLGNTSIMASMLATWQVNRTIVDGWYIYARWVPGLENLSSQKFEQDYLTMFKEEPDGTMEMMCDMLWLSVRAIELAGTNKDRTAIASAARSGNMTLETPSGNMTWGTDGEPVQTPGVLAHVEQSKLVPVQNK